jgi:hypothetical protein
MVHMLVALPDARAQTEWLAEALKDRAPVLRSSKSPKTKSEAEWFLGDIESVTRGAAKLQVRLRDKPLHAFEPAITTLITTALHALTPVLTHLNRSVERAMSGKDLRDAAME